jgi:hypothetical protein
MSAIFFGYLLPIATTLTVTTQHGVNPFSDAGCNALVLLLPFVNWMLMLGFLLTPSERALLLLPLATWSAAALVAIPVLSALSLLRKPRTQE